jgi:hypothetical protein
MRIRATVAALSGVLALSALAVPAAHAVTSSPATIGKVTVNAGKPIVLDSSGTKTFTASVTASDDSGIQDAFVELYTPKNQNVYIDSIDAPAKCTVSASSATTSTCVVTFKVSARTTIKDSSLAGVWTAIAAAVPNDVNTKTGDGIVTKDNAATAKVQRLSKLTADATPEPVKKGKTITVSGKLTYANWKSGGYTGGYANQSVQLQFRKKSATTYTTVKTVKTGTAGALKTTVTASVDGYYRFVSAGTTATAAVTSAADYIDVQ